MIVYNLAIQYFTTEKHSVDQTLDIFSSLPDQINSTPGEHSSFSNSRLATVMVESLMEVNHLNRTYKEVIVDEYQCTSLRTL
jgi:flagellin-specific chaperone FliS